MELSIIVLTITARFSFAQLYGIFEIRARMPKGRRLWPCFWLLPVNGIGRRRSMSLKFWTRKDKPLQHRSYKASGTHNESGVAVQCPTRQQAFITTRSIGRRTKSLGISTRPRSATYKPLRICTRQCISLQISGRRFRFMVGKSDASTHSSRFMPSTG